MNSQFWAFDALRSFGTSTYHSMQVSLRKAFSKGFQFDLNYTLSKSTDLVSVAARVKGSARFRETPTGLRSASSIPGTASRSGPFLISTCATN